MTQGSVVGPQVDPFSLALSYSASAMHWKCPASYGRRYVLKEKAPWDEDATVRVVGTVVDRAARQFFLSARAGQPDPSLLQAAPGGFLREEITKQLANPKVRLGPGKFAETPEEAVKVIAEAADNLRGMIDSESLIRGQSVLLTEDHEFLGTTGFGDWRNPLVVNPWLRVTGKFDYFGSRDQRTPGRLVDFKASRSVNFLDPHQLKLYQLALRLKWGLEAGMAGYGLFTQRRFHWYNFTADDLKETEQRFTETAVRIAEGVFPYTPSYSACRLCPYRTSCKDAVLKDAEAPVVVPRAPIGTPSTLLDMPDL